MRQVFVLGSGSGRCPTEEAPISTTGKGWVTAKGLADPFLPGLTKWGSEAVKGKGPGTHLGQG